LQSSSKEIPSLSKEIPSFFQTLPNVFLGGFVRFQGLGARKNEIGSFLVFSGCRRGGSMKATPRRTKENSSTASDIQKEIVGREDCGARHRP
jgi:hypothetical protein